MSDVSTESGVVPSSPSNTNPPKVHGTHLESHSVQITAIRFNHIKRQEFGDEVKNL